MTQLVSLIQTATYDSTPANLRLPSVVWTTFTALNKVHGLWRWYRRAEVYRKPENLVSLVAGHVINWIIGDSVIVRVAAQFLLVATRILECAQQQAGICRAGHRWVSALKGHYPAPVYVEWEKPTSDGWLSPSTVHWWKTVVVTAWERISRIALCTLDLFTRAFRLSMTIMDVIDALCWSPAAKDDAINEGFVNISKCLANIVANKEELLEGLTDNKALIERFLKNSPITFDKLHSGVSKVLDKTELVHNVVQKISKVGSGIVVGTKKGILNGTKVIARISKFKLKTLIRRRKDDQKKKPAFV